MNYFDGNVDGVDLLIVFFYYGCIVVVVVLRLKLFELVFGLVLGCKVFICFLFVVFWFGYFCVVINFVEFGIWCYGVMGCFEVNG